MASIRQRLTYANVMATLAVFIALGGGAYALTRGEVKSKHIAKDAVKAKHIDFGVRSIPMLASFQDLPAGVGSGVFPVVGTGSFGGGFPETIAPQPFTARDLVVQLRSDDPLAAGSRDFYLQVGGDATALRCTIDAGDRRCRSSARVRVRTGQSMYLGSGWSGTTDDDDAQVAWRAVLP